MGNSASRRRPKEYSISPGEDAVQDLLPSNFISSLQDNTIFLNETFHSLDLSEMDDNNPCSSRFVTGVEEFPERLNCSNFHTSFFASLIWGGNKSSEPETQTLINVVDSHRWSAQCPEYVSLCASFILSTLQIYGHCIPQDRAVISQKSVLMFNALDDLHELLSNMKQKSWHIDETTTRWNSCRDCDIRQMVLMQVNVQDGVKKKLCPVCLQFRSDCKAATHNRLKTCLLAEIYPFSCFKCQMRFCSEVDLQHHCDLICPIVAVVGQAEEISSKLFCCFLCRLPFKNRRDLTKHSQSSLEHALRKEVATELALRKVTSDESCNLQLNSDSSLIKTVPDVCEENPIETTTSSPDVSDAQYYCSPCSTFVQKCNVVDHERGLKHRLKCEGWMKCLRKKPKGTFQEINTSSENQATAAPRSKVCLRDASTSMENIESESVDQQIKKLLEKFLVLEKDQVECSGGRYLCIKCSFKGEAFEMLTHRLGYNKSKNHQCCSYPEEETQVVLEEKIRIITCLVSLCVKGQMYDLLKLINMNAVQQLIDTLCLKKSHNLSDDKLSEIEITNDFQNNVSTSVPVSIEKSICNREELQGEQSLPQPPAVKPTFSEGNDIPEQQKVSTEFIHSSDIVTPDDVTRATQRYIILNELIEIPKGCYKCQRCDVRGPTRAIITHLLGKSHLHLRYNTKQAISILEERLRILNFFNFAKTVNPLVVSHIQSNQLLFGRTVTHDLLELRRQQELVAENNSLQLQISKNKETDVISSTPQLVCSKLPTASNIAPPATVSGSLEHSKSPNETEECESLRNTIIGVSATESLQEEVQNACAGRDLSEFEIECETCGALFQVFNNDVDLSLDMHIETDPQHALATAVPVDRNAQSVAEITKGMEAAKPEISEVEKRLKVTLENNEKQVAEFKRNKEKVVEGILKMEQKYVVKRGTKYFCEFCGLTLNSESQVTHHILLPKHMSLKWMKKHTPEELQQKLLQLKPLLKYRYAGGAVTSAMGLIDEFLGNKVSSAELPPHNVAKPTHKENPLLFYCEICKISMTVGSQLQHLRGKRHMANTSAVLKSLKLPS